MRSDQKSYTKLSTNLRSKESRSDESFQRSFCSNGHLNTTFGDVFLRCDIFQFLIPHKDSRTGFFRCFQIGKDFFSPKGPYI